MRRVGANHPATPRPQPEPFPLSPAPSARPHAFAAGRGRVAVACFVVPPTRNSNNTRTTYGKVAGADIRGEYSPPPPPPKRGRDPTNRLQEAVALASALGLRPAQQLLLAPATPQAATLLSNGQLERVKQALLADPAELLFVDATLSPSQQRNLENRLLIKVLDRTGVILEIFARRARSTEGRLQVEQAQLAWQGSRLVRSWTHLERQRGGGQKAAGPGERQLELDKRMLEQRLKRTRQRLAVVRKRRGEQRKGRTAKTATVALVGYTNAGKSTLFDALTRTDADKTLGADHLFATLDPLMRKLDLPVPMEVVLSDTVGFVSDLPHGLVEAFHATLEEVRQADLIVQVHDAASTDAAAQAEDVAQVLATLLPKDNPPPILHLRNKADLLQKRRGQQRSGQQQNTGHDGLLLSARDGTGLPALRQALVEALDLRFGVRTVEVFLPHARATKNGTEARVGALRGWLHRNAYIEAQRSDATGEWLVLRLPQAGCQQLTSRARQEPWLKLCWKETLKAHPSPPPVAQNFSYRPQSWAVAS